MCTAGSSPLIVNEEQNVTMGDESIERQLQEIERQLNAVEERPATTLGILGESKLEKHWESLLVYFLDSDNPHNLGTAVLEAMLNAISSHCDTTLTTPSSSTDLDKVDVQTQVPTGHGPVDILLCLQDEWFVCIELKVTSPETGEQTVHYANASRLGDISINQFDGEEEYIYLAPRYAAPPTADEFKPLSWKHAVEHLVEVLSSDVTQYHSKSNAQLADFLDTIQRELGMTDTNTISRETELYLKYSETINELEDAYEEDKSNLFEEFEANFFDDPAISREEWAVSRHGNNYIKLYKPDWQNVGEGVNIEYEPHIHLKRSEPRILLRLDVENENKHDVRDELREKLGADLSTELEASGWEDVDERYAFFSKSIPLEFDQPKESLHHAVQELKELHTIVAPLIDEIVTEHRSQ